MKHLKLVVFDLGGTLIEDVGHVPAAFQAALGAHGYSASSDEIARWRGASKREVIRRIVGERDGVDDGASELVYETFQGRLIDLFRQHGVRLVEGAGQAIERLRSAGLRVAVTTGFDRLVTREVLDVLDRGLLNAVVCGDDVSAGRPAPYMIFRAMESAGIASIHEVANVGDTTNDLQAGYCAGVAANVGVLTGAHGKAALLRAPHTHILESAALVPDALVPDQEPPGLDDDSGTGSQNGRCELFRRQ